MPPEEALAPVERLDDNSPRLGASVELRYTARVGLLPELSRQTYDSLYKALREAILNAVDAGATVLIVASGIFGQPDPAGAAKELSMIAEGA